MAGGRDSHACPVCGGGRLEPFFEMPPVPVYCNVSPVTRDEALAMPRSLALGRVVLRQVRRGLPPLRDLAALPLQVPERLPRGDAIAVRLPGPLAAITRDAPEDRHQRVLRDVVYVVVRAEQVAHQVSYAREALPEEGPGGLAIPEGRRGDACLQRLPRRFVSRRAAPEGRLRFGRSGREANGRRGDVR